MQDLFTAARLYIGDVIIWLGNVFIYASKPFREVIEDIAAEFGEQIDLSQLAGTFIGDISIFGFIGSSLLLVTIIIWIAKFFLGLDD